MSEAIMKPSPLQKDPSFESSETSKNSKPSHDGEIKRFQSAPVDADTGAVIFCIVIRALSLEAVKQAKIANQVTAMRSKKSYRLL